MKIHKKKCFRMEIHRERSYFLTMFLFWKLPKPSATPWCNGSTTGFGPVSPGSNPGGVAIFPGFAAAAAAIFLHLSANSIPRPVERRTADKIRKNRDFCIFPLFSILGFRQSCSIINTNLEPFYKELNGR